MTDACDKVWPQTLPDREFKISYGKRRNSLKWRNSTITIPILYERLKQTERTEETAAEYAAMDKPVRDQIKDRGGFVGGHLKDGRRLKEKVLCRSMGALDIDYPKPGFLAWYRTEHRFLSFLYTTHSHTPEAPRYRLIVFFTRDVSPDEYEAIMRFLAAEIDMEGIDPVSFRINQLMHWPTTSSDGEYIFEVFDGPLLDPDAFLAEHPDWKDMSTWPVAPTEKNAVAKESKHQQDPLIKGGIIGAFNNAFYPIDTLLDSELSDVYEPTEGSHRYTHIGSTGTAGAVIYEDKFLYSFHSTDPAYGKLLSAFDLMRVCRYGDLDEKESLQAALNYAASLPEVQEILAEEKATEAAEEFSELDEPPEAGMPKPVCLSDIGILPPRPPELIHGILRQGHKMLVAGPSKAGKSFLLMELAICIAEGQPWLGFPCSQGKVLYVNLEIDPASCYARFDQIYKRYDIAHRRTDNILIWNLRGYALPLDRLVPLLIKEMEGETIAAVIVDPIYKVITGDENNASEMGAFCNQFDKICTALGASVIYCHHHSKGYQGGKRAMDRASGSGVFARDPDALLDIIELRKPRALSDDEDEEDFEDFDVNRSAWRMEASLREFPPIRPVNFWFEHPTHVLDTKGELAGYHPDGSAGANLAASSKRTGIDMRKRRLDEAYDAAPKDKPVTVRTLARIANVSAETMRRYLKEFEDEYMVANGIVQERPPLSDSPGATASTNQI